MTDVSPSLTFNLSGYDHRAACRVLTQRLMPAHLRNLVWILVAFLVGMTVLVIMSVRLGYRFSGYEAYLLAGVAYVILLWGLRKRRHLLWQAVAEAPFRSGPITATMGEKGLSIASDAGQATYFWKAIVEAIPGKDGIMVLLGGMDLIPIPASAFANAEAQSLFLDQLLSHIRTAKEVQSDHT